MIPFLLIALFSWIAQLFLPWWSMAFVAAILSFFISQKNSHAFFSGFFACGLVWLLMAIYVSVMNGSLMNDRIAQLFSLPSSTLLYLVSFLVAAITGGLASLTGRYIKQAL